MEKCSQILNTNQFVKLNSEPTKATGTYRLAKHLAKLLSRLSTSEYTVEIAKKIVEKI